MLVSNSSRFHPKCTRRIRPIFALHREPQRMRTTFNLIERDLRASKANVGAMEKRSLGNRICAKRWFRIAAGSSPNFTCRIRPIFALHKEPQRMRTTFNLIEKDLRASKANVGAMEKRSLGNRICGKCQFRIAAGSTQSSHVGFGQFLPYTGNPSE